jgi:hypothetical protein
MKLIVRFILLLSLLSITTRYQHAPSEIDSGENGLRKKR